MRILLIVLASISFQLSAPGYAQEQARPVPCSTDNYRQFDFWVGEWNVTSDGKQAGTNRIEKVHNDCALAEHWQGAGNFSGSSYNIYDWSTGQWHQTWVDSTGTLLQLDGGLVDGSMVLQGQRLAIDGSGAMQTHKVTWTPNSDGSVRQHWEASTDDGETWKTVFDAIYRKKQQPADSDTAAMQN